MHEKGEFTVYPKRFVEKKPGVSLQQKMSQICIMEPRTYLLKKGTHLYRGDTPYFLNMGSKMEKNGKRTILLSESLHLEEKPTFFALEPDQVYQYGIIYGWEVPDDIELPLLDNHEVMTEIYNGAPPNVKEVMEQNYGYRPDRFEGRVSYFEKDIIFYQYLCDKGYPGYASYDLEEGVRTSIEIMVCNPIGYRCVGMFFPNDVKDQKMYIDNQIQKYYERVNPNRNQKKKKAKIYKLNASPVKGNLFGDSPDVKGNLFGDSHDVKGNLFGDSPVKGNLFGDSPVKGNLFGDSPVKGNLFGDSPDVKENLSPDVKGNLFGDSPAKGKSGSRKGGKSKKNRKPKVTRRRR